MMLRRDIFNFGGLKVISDRAATYANRVLTLINLALLVNLNAMAGMDLMQYAWLAIFGLVAFAALTLFDLIVIYPQEINFRDTRSDVMDRMHHKLDKILVKVEK